jgi:hypothetical protein
MDGEGMPEGDWRERKRAEVFESTLRGLEGHRRSDPSFGVADADGTLQHLYIAEGNNWLGRGELGDIVNSATIAAYEHFIYELKREAADRSAARGEAE